MNAYAEPNPPSLNICQREVTRVQRELDRRAANYRRTGKSYPVPKKSTAAERILKAHYWADELCKGGGDDTATHLACLVRDYIIAPEMDRAGWCYHYNAETPPLSGYRRCRGKR